MEQARRKTIDTISHAIKQHGAVLFAYLFGSYARDDVGPLSDIDVAVYFESNTSFEGRLRINSGIEDALYKRLKLFGEQRVHIQTLNELYDKSIALEQEIVYNGMVIYVKDDRARAHYEAGAMHRVCDWLPHQEKFNTATLENIERPIEPYRVYAKYAEHL